MLASAGGSQHPSVCTYVTDWEYLQCADLMGVVRLPARVAVRRNTLCSLASSPSGSVLSSPYSRPDNYCYVRALTCSQERISALSCFQAFEEVSHEFLCDVCTVGSLPMSQVMQSRGNKANYAFLTALDRDSGSVARREALPVGRAYPNTGLHPQHKVLAGS